MIFSDTIIENKEIFLRNLVKADTTDWTSPSSSYGMFTANYETPLGIEKLYYVGFTYKFTTNNQSPTWVQFYSQGGSATWGPDARISNPIAGTEYSKTSIYRPSRIATLTLLYGIIYNGDAGAINGVQSQVKNVFVYEVDELYMTLRALGLATTEAQLKTWCDANLTYHAPNDNYNITSEVFTKLQKIDLKGGSITADDIIEPDGMQFYSYSDILRNNTYFDTGSGVSTYNNKNNGTVTLSRIEAQTQGSPFYPQHKYILQITTDGTAAPGAGGVIATHRAAANKIFVEKFVAKIPVGYTVNAAYNSQGTGAVVSYLSSRAGTGDWAEYTILYKYGTEGSFSSGGHVYITGSNNTSVTWYIAYINNCDITGYEYLKNYTVLGNVDRIKAGTLFSRNFDVMNLLPNGNGAKLDRSVLSNASWFYDTEDIAGNAKASIVQPKNATGCDFGGWIKVLPGVKYKLSYWVKCKKDMTSFLTAIQMKCNGTSVTHSTVGFVANTYTRLTQELKSGDTSMVVQSNANWISKAYSKVGFRSTSSKSYNDIGISNGMTGNGSFIAGTEGTTIVNFNAAYTGATRPASTYVVESFDGGTYPYPIQKGSLPDDNEWKYVEGVFGGTTLWTGSGGNWPNLPGDITEICVRLNIYKNDGTVPIKFSDIRLEPVNAGVLTRHENKIDIIGGM